MLLSIYLDMSLECREKAFSAFHWPGDGRMDVQRTGRCLEGIL
jgi:hypothetical protein